MPGDTSYLTDAWQRAGRHETAHVAPEVGGVGRLAGSNNCALAPHTPCVMGIHVCTVLRLRVSPTACLMANIVIKVVKTTQMRWNVDRTWLADS